MCEEKKIGNLRKRPSPYISIQFGKITNNFWISSAPEFHTNKKLTYITFKRNDWTSMNWLSTFQENGYLLSINSTSPRVIHWFGSLGSIRHTKQGTFFFFPQHKRLNEVGEIKCFFLPNKDCWLGVSKSLIGSCSARLVLVRNCL